MNHKGLTLLALAFFLLVLSPSYQLAHLALADTNPGGGDQIPGGGISISLPNPLGCDDIACIAQKITDALLQVSIPIVAIMVLVGAFQMITSAGNPEKFASGEKTIRYAAIGFAIVLLATSLVSIIESIFK